jgi:protein phosphatase
MELWGITDNGKVRKRNQDVYKILVREEDNTAVLVVCDGMGGANAGNIASELAADIFIGNISENIDDTTDLIELADKMTDAVIAANVAVFDKGLYEDKYHGMGTTLTAAISTAQGEVVANIGDSRAYQISNGEITQVTKDHSVVEEMIDRGEISRSEANKHPSKNLITRAIGTGIYDPPDIFFLNLNNGEFILLCTDGLSNVVTDSEILSELKQGNTVRESCEALVDLALTRGAPDNVTAVILKK